ncbi:MAG: gliding motility-associated C-terminal domain-containing protein, partial [Bacteroidota bacterium]
MRYLCLSLTLLFLCAFSFLIAQDCFNADFEVGDASGYRTYTGYIDNAGNIVVDNERYSERRHKITTILDPVDEIAKRWCVVNDSLPVVPPTGGRYAMRLGNEFVGGEAERVLLSFTVTGATSFFLLRYAVVLEDPAHEEFEQPRFELTILDRNGDPYPCGIYKVRAGPDIEGFENCGDWRVRPWTTVGIELQSFLGQEIQIEILTSDCSRGGHAGYAYFDATCSPLEIDLFGYCENATSAEMRVTNGFTKYQWNTGDSTDQITINNPQEGDIYYVTVTSATGCELVLSDTIPAIEAIVPPSFDPPSVTNLCKDSVFWFRPTGTNLSRIYSPDYGLFLDSFLIQTDLRQDYTFVAFSDFGCGFDTVVYTFINNFDVSQDVQDVSCFGGNDGAIRLTSNSPSLDLEYLWSNNSTESFIENLQSNQYSVTITDQFDCVNELSFEVDQPREMNLDISFGNDQVCEGESNGSVRVFVTGGFRPIEISYDGGQSYSSSLSESNLSPGRYLIIAKDANGCLDSIEYIISEIPIPELPTYSIKLDSCGLASPQICLFPPLGGPYYYRIDNGPRFENLNYQINSGDHTLEISSADDCKNYLEFNVPERSPFAIDAIEIEQPTCDGINGIVEIIPNRDETNTYSLDNINFQVSNRFENLLPGRYNIYVLNSFNCMVMESFILNEPLIVEAISTEYFACNSQENITVIEANFGPGPYEYSIDGINYQSENLFTGVPAGEQLAYVKDNDGCILSQAFEIESYDPINIGNVNFSEPDCGIDNGSILIELSGGYGDTKVSLNEDEFFNQGTFNDLVSGLYAFIIEDESDCFEEVVIQLPSDCKVFVPNVFSPNGDGINDNFTIQGIESYPENQLFIFSRWG